MARFDDITPSNTTNIYFKTSSRFLLYPVFERPLVSSRKLGLYLFSILPLQIVACITPGTIPEMVSDADNDTIKLLLFFLYSFNPLQRSWSIIKSEDVIRLVCFISIVTSTKARENK